MSNPTSNGFQSFVNAKLPAGVAGDFAGANIRASLVGASTGESGIWRFVAPAAGCLIGAFAWADPATGLAGNYYKPNSLLGFVHRENNALITPFLGISSQSVVPGNMVNAYSQGDFWGLFAAGATVGQKVYCDPVTGALTANATGNSVTVTISSTGLAITSSVMTTTDADVTGTIAVGQIVVAAGVPEGTYIASSAGTGSGTHLWNLANVNGTTIANVTGETGTLYGVQETPFYVNSTVTADASVTASIAAPVAPAAASVMTVTAVGSGSLAAGQFLNATGIGPNVQIISQLTGTAGSTGTYLVSANSVVSSTTITATQGKLGIISSWTT